MNRFQRESCRFIIASAIISGAFAVAPIGPTGCADTQAYLQTPQGQALLVTSGDIANVALSAAANQLGGPMAGQMASAGLSALGAVMQGYINKPIPTKIVKASPGVPVVGNAVAPLVSPVKPVTQVDVNEVFKAAKIAAKK